ncbi:MAG: hypothetical protein ACPH4M_03210 [Flavobacteriaceae bacterium]
MKKLLLISAFLIFACSSDGDGTNDPNSFNRTYIGQFEINSVGEYDFWCWETTGTIQIGHFKQIGDDNVSDEDIGEYSRSAYLFRQGSCNLPYYFDDSYQNDDVYQIFTYEYSNNLEDFWSSIFLGAIVPSGDFIADYFLYCEVTSFESSNLSAVSNTIQGVIKQSKAGFNDIRTIGTFTATLQ